jgi:hypothetical protein
MTLYRDLMYYLAISALVIGICCWGILVLRNLPYILGSFPYPDYTKKLDRADKILAILAWVLTLFYLAVQLAKL